MLKGKTVLITGSTSGIGLGIAHAFARHNANIILNGIANKKEVDALLKEIHGITSGKAIFSDADMSKPAEIDAMMVKVTKAFGGVDILVNNAGIQVVHPLEDYPEDKWEAIISINLSAAFYTTKAVFPYMKEKKWGRIVNIASAHGLVGSPFKSAYVAAKHGLVGLTKVAALEGGTFGIRCNAICPGYTWTPLVEKQIKDTAIARGIPESEVIEKVMLVEHATKQFTTIKQLADTAVFLCSPATDNMTGTTISIDGGWTAH
jgi:3-hydroxybutyrate dehydrogenase